MKLENIAQTLAPLPLSSHGKPVDSFSQADELENELKRVVKGEVRFDRRRRPRAENMALQFCRAEPERVSPDSAAMSPWCWISPSI
jgi:hypothetical protein